MVTFAAHVDWHIIFFHLRLDNSSSEIQCDVQKVYYFSVCFYSDLEVVPFEYLKNYVFRISICLWVGAHCEAIITLGNYLLVITVGPKY